MKAGPEDVDAIGRTLRPPTTQLGRGNARDRRRETRRQRQDLPRLWSARISSGTELELVDLSKRGILVETTSRMTLGSTLDLQFVGQNTDISIPARVLRSDIAKVDGLGVKYRVAAQFKRDLDLLDYLTGASDSRTTPAALADVLARALADVERRSPSASLGRFEEELRNLLPVRAIQIRQSPLVSNDESNLLRRPRNQLRFSRPRSMQTIRRPRRTSSCSRRPRIWRPWFSYAPLPEK